MTLKKSALQNTIGAPMFHLTLPTRQHEWLHVVVGLYKKYLGTSVPGGGQVQHSQQGEVWMEFPFRRRCTAADRDSATGNCHCQIGG